MDKPTIYSLALEALAELAPEINAAGADVAPVLPSLTEALSDLAPLPRASLFFGIAEDGLPVLLNLHDPLPGPLLVCAESGAGKTAFLKVVAQAVVEIHDPNEVQFAVLTAHPEEWKGFDPHAHCAGIFPLYDKAAMDFIFSLGKWAHENKPRQFIALLVDDFSRMEEADPEAKDTLRWLLLRGPTRRVWPIVSLDPKQSESVLPWLELFRTRIFGRIQNARLAESVTGSARGGLESLVKGSQFAMLEGARWLRFWIPRLDEGESK